MSIRLKELQHCTSFAQVAYFSVEEVRFAYCTALCTVAISTVLLQPPRESFSTCVSFELRYGTCTGDGRFFVGLVLFKQVLLILLLLLRPLTMEVVEAPLCGEPSHLQLLYKCGDVGREE